MLGEELEAIVASLTVEERETLLKELQKAEELEEVELARLLHVDADNTDELANLKLYKRSAEEYLLGAGVEKDYKSALYTDLVVALIARRAERPDALSKFNDIESSGLVAMIAQLRQSQAYAKGGASS
ncbi:MAG: hypothetical protein J6M62_02205 [Selenomonadaceae bacterium]|nr:hypothetical protein [Selenomonadaceae bacterium]MBP3722458.1 hypothetical protein [Selenomonadaceae bacterium]